MTSALILILAVSMIVSANGCMSTFAREDKRVSGVYPGVRSWPSEMKSAFNPGEDPLDALKPLEVPFLVLDLPGTCVLDTILLPADLLPKKTPSRTP